MRRRAGAGARSPLSWSPLDRWRRAGGDRRSRTGASVGARPPARRTHARHGTSRPSANSGAGWSTVRAACGRARGICTRPGRAPRCRARSGFRQQPRGVPVVRRAGQWWHCRHGGRAGTAHRHGTPGRACHLSPGAEGRQRAHFGSRIVFRPDGTLFVTQGDRADYPRQAQDLSSGIGKIVRINPDGSIPRDNPFVGRNDARPEIWSYGHRNIQAAALHPETNQLWTVEHGARGGDELNHPEAGKNYGWPVITYGRDYSGRSIGEGAVKAGMEQPVYYWDPVIAPSGMIFYTGDAFPGWKGSILVGGLTPGRLVRLTLVNGRVATEEQYLGDLGERIRDVQQGTDGTLYLITDSREGRVLRVSPGSRR